MKLPNGFLAEIHVLVPFLQVEYDSSKLHEPLPNLILRVRNHTRIVLCHLSPTKHSKTNEPLNDFKDFIHILH